MLLTHLVQAAIDWSLIFGSSCGPLGAPCPCNSAGFLGIGGELNCPGSTFTPIAAAYQTQGMWVQADLLQQIRFTGLGSLAALMYLWSAIGGLIGVALGSPPKMYLWFFLGPPIFHFLIGTPYALKGTEWRVANQPQDQRQVWRMAEVGLLNSNWKSKRDGVYNNQAPDSTVNVSWFFAYYDQIVSHVVQNLTAWTGLYNMRGSQQDIQSGVGESPDNATQLPSIASGNWLGDRWWLLSNSKWSMVEDITNAKLANPMIRDALTTFMASECGDAMMSNMNSSAFLNALYYKGRNSPGSVFNGSSKMAAGDYEQLFRDMYAQRVPMPRSLRALLKDHPDEGSSFVYSVHMGIPSANNDMRERMINAQYIRCPAYLHLLIESFRWEAGQIYHQFRISAPAGVSEQWLAFYLLYGWNVRMSNGNADPAQWPHLTPEQLPEFIKNLILVHLIRNEMMIQPISFTNRKLSTRQTEDSGEGHLRFIATKNKFSELYQWALMVPHMQGILLYYLAIAFPFSAMMMVVPGYHKVTFTWMTFWLWAKLWDLGFAMVTSLERSVWAMVGNNSAIQGNLPKIAEMVKFGHVTVTACPTSACTASCIDQVDKSCLFSRIELFNGPLTNSGYGSDSGTTDLLSYESFEGAMRIFDRALTIAANLDLDLSNSYYIYIMAGLYFSVPVVVGQLVLGAKSGSASLIGNIIGAVGQEAGRQGAAGHQSDMIYRIKAAKAAVGQEAFAKAMRSSGLAGQAIGHGNEQIMAGMNRAGLEAAAGGARSIAQAAQLTRANAGAFADAGTAMGGAMIKTAGNALGGVEKARSNRAAGTTAAQRHGELVAAVQGRALPQPGGRAPSSRGGGASAAGAGLANGGLDANNPGGESGNFYQVLGSLPAGPAEVARKGAGRLFSALGIVEGGLTAAGDLGTAAKNVGMLPYQQNASNSEMGSQLVQSQSAIGGFGYGQQGALQGASENRVGAQAEFDARTAAWDAENAYSNQFAALSTALGFFAGGLEAGSKPVDRMGMAMSGNFGADTQASAQAVTPGSSIWNRALEMQGSINSQYGPGRAKEAYMVPELSEMWSFTGGVVGKGVSISLPGGTIPDGIPFIGGAKVNIQPTTGISPGAQASTVGQGGKSAIPVR